MASQKPVGKTTPPSVDFHQSAFGGSVFASGNDWPSKVFRSRQYEWLVMMRYVSRSPAA
jgi:hypothetical protein